MSNITDKVVVITAPAAALGKAPRNFSHNKEQEVGTGRRGVRTGSTLSLRRSRASGGPTSPPIAICHRCHEARQKWNMP